MSWFRQNRKEYHKQYREKHRKMLREKAKQYYKDNCDRIKEYQEQHRKKHREEIREYHKQYRRDNYGRLGRQGRQYRKDHPEKAKQWRMNNPEYQKQWRMNNREHIRHRRNCYNRNRYKTDLKYNLNIRMAKAIRQSLKGNKGGKHWEGLVPYDYIQVKKCLEKTMPEGYTWQDFLDGLLHIDHRIPISVFNFTKPEHIGFQKCWALDNLRLLPAEENRRKNDKLEEPFQPALTISV